MWTQYSSGKLRSNGSMGTALFRGGPERCQPALLCARELALPRRRAPLVPRCTAFVSCMSTRARRRGSSGTHRRAPLPLRMPSIHQSSTSVTTAQLPPRSFQYLNAHEPAAEPGTTPPLRASSCAGLPLCHTPTQRSHAGSVEAGRPLRGRVRTVPGAGGSRTVGRTRAGRRCRPLYQRRTAMSRARCPPPSPSGGSYVQLSSGGRGSESGSNCASSLSHVSCRCGDVRAHGWRAVLRTESSAMLCGAAEI